MIIWVVPRGGYLSGWELGPIITSATNVSTIRPTPIAADDVAEPSIELLDVIVSGGWDINQCDHEAVGRGRRLVEFLVHDEDMVRWRISHGAKIPTDLADTDPYLRPALTEDMAAMGTVSCFLLIRSLGAPLGRRTLHRAAKSAGTCRATERNERMKMVQFLVEEEGLDVNQLDCDEPMPNHWGTVIA